MTVPGNELWEAGQLVRQARNERSLLQKRVAEEVGISRTSLSLFERGKRALRPDKLDRLVRAVSADGTRVFQLTGQVPPAAVVELLGPELAGALEDGVPSPAARHSLRRLHLAGMTRDLDLPRQGQAVDITTLLYEEFDIDTQPADVERCEFQTDQMIRYPRHLDEPDRDREKRFQLAHMCGHAVAERGSQRRLACPAPVTASEVEATFIAGLILVPPAALGDAFQVARTTYGIDSAEQLAGLIDDLASNFAVPLWLAAQRIAEERLLAFAAGLERL